MISGLKSKIEDHETEIFIFFINKFILFLSKYSTELIFKVGNGKKDSPISSLKVTLASNSDLIFSSNNLTNLCLSMKNGTANEIAARKNTKPKKKFN